MTGRPDLITPVCSYDYEGARRALQWLWDLGLGEATHAAAREPLIESYDFHLGGRHGLGREFVEEALRKPWMMLPEVDLEHCWDDIDRQRRQFLTQLFEDQTSRNSTLSRPWDQLLSTMESADDTFDPEMFTTWVAEAHIEHAREHGCDHLFDLVPRLTGQCDGSFSCDLFLPHLITDDEPQSFIPLLSFPTDATHDWARLFQKLHIHPADFAQAIHHRVTTWMHSNDSLSSSERDLIVTTLEQQGLSDAVSGDPATWRAGLACVAGSYAQHCSSLPEPMEPPSVSMEALLNLLSSTDELVNMNVFFSLGAHELTEHSELLECFDRKSPGCGESLAALTLCVSSPEMTLNGQTLDVQGPFYFLYDQAYFFEDQDYRNSCRPVSLPSRQEAARAAKACWTERESSRGANDSSSGMETQAAQASLSLLPHALQQWAHEQYPRLIPAPTSKSVPAPLSLDDFHLSDGCFIKAPWRLHQLHTLVHRCDAFGNTLAHKAIRLLDPGLLEFSLRHHRALATQANLAGVRPIDLLWNTSHSHHFIPLACILMSFAPDLAATLSPQGEPMLSRAFYRDIKFESSKLEYMTQLLDAGASFNGRYSNGDALWSTWGSLNTSPLIARIVLAMDRGWDINSTDRHGQTLAHVSSSLETLQALHRLGADMMLKDSQQRLPGYLIQDAHQRTLWEHYLLEHHLSSPQASPRRALSL